MLIPTTSVGAFLLLLALAGSALADTPANCTYEDARGWWQFDVSEARVNCSEKGETLMSYKINLLYPRLAVDEFGHEGTWTIIYNQGFEVQVANRKWLVKYAYEDETKFYCDRGIPMWTHDNLIRQWYCSYAHKLSDRSSVKSISPSQEEVKGLGIKSAKFDAIYQPDQDFVDRINAVQTSWKAVVYPEHSQFTLRDMLMRSGGVLSSGFIDIKVNHALEPLASEMRRKIAQLPPEFNWRHAKPSPVTPVRSQEHCGSCYAFASTGAMESRIRLWTNFTVQPILSPQDVIDCSPYSEGCDGGFSYLIAGKYAEDFGISTEDCIPYKGVEQGYCPASRNTCQLYYSTNYHYVGGYYGATNEELMKVELIHGGPLPVALEVYSDFMHYHGGVYRHTKEKSLVNDFNPFELTNHAVLLVGYGIDQESGLAYWDVKNSWGDSWGEDGFFRILRGHDECAIESCAVAFDPIV